MPLAEVVRVEAAAVQEAVPAITRSGFREFPEVGEKSGRKLLKEKERLLDLKTNLSHPLQC